VWYYKTSGDATSRVANGQTDIKLAVTSTPDQIITASELKSIPL